MQKIERRTDVITASYVERGVYLRRIAGWDMAARFMKLKNIRADISARVQSGGLCRASDQDLR